MPESKLPTTFYRVLRLHQQVAGRIEAALEPAGMSAHQYTVLSLIRRFAPVSSAEIARKLQVTAQSAGESIKVLEARALVARALLPENRRSHALSVTAPGRRALARADKLVLAAEDQFFAHLTAQERAEFVRTVQRLRYPEGAPVDMPG